MLATGHKHAQRARLAGLLGFCCVLTGAGYPSTRVEAAAAVGAADQPTPTQPESPRPLAGEGQGEGGRDGTAPSPSLSRERARSLAALSPRNDSGDARNLTTTATPSPPPGVPEPPPVIDVYTMGPGDDLFSRFGHAAICVSDAQSPEGRCYNYGTADFSTPGPLTWSFVRGRALFWVSVVPQPYMVAVYQHEDRTLWRQRLPLPADEARALARLLHNADVREATFYRYHHFNDNCTTRIRDLVDQVTGGALRRDSQVATDPPLRHYVQKGFAGQPLLLLVTDLLLGRAADRPTTRWQGMFLPELLRSELQVRLQAPPEVVYERQKPLVIGASWGGGWLLVPSGALLALLAWALWSGLRSPRLAAGLVGVKLGVVAVVVVGLAACAALPELRYNEALLLCWPTDLLLLGMAPRRVVGYARLRLGGLLLAVIGLQLGVLIQPLVPVVGFYALPLAVLALQRARVGGE